MWNSESGFVELLVMLDTERPVFVMNLFKDRQGESEGRVSLLNI